MPKNCYATSCITYLLDFEDFKRQKPLIADTLVWMEKNTL